MSPPKDTSSSHSIPKKDVSQDEERSARIQDLTSMLSERIRILSMPDIATRPEQYDDVRTQQREESDDASSNDSTSQLDDSPDQGIVQEGQSQKICTKFSRLMHAMINCKLDESQVRSQERHASPRPYHHFEENMREEALIIDAIAGPGATDAEKEKVADEAAEVRRKLAERATESVAESVARDAEATGPLRAARRAKQEAAEYEKELAAMKRLIAIASSAEDEDKEWTDQERYEALASLDGMSAFASETLGPLRQMLQGPGFEALKLTAGSFDGAVESLFEMAWAEEKRKEEMWKREQRERRGKSTGKAEG